MGERDSSFTQQGYPVCVIHSNSILVRGKILVSHIRSPILKTGFAQQIITSLPISILLPHFGITSINVHGVSSSNLDTWDSKDHPPTYSIIHRSIHRKRNAQRSCKERKGISPRWQNSRGPGKTQKLKTWCPRGYQISIQPHGPELSRTPGWRQRHSINAGALKGCPLHQNETRKFLC